MANLPPGYLANCIYTPTLAPELAKEYPGFVCALQNSKTGKYNEVFSGYNNEGTLACQAPGGLSQPCQEGVCPIGNYPCYGITNIKTEYANPIVNEPSILCLDAESYRSTIPHIADTYQGAVCVGVNQHYDNVMVSGISNGSSYCSPDYTGKTVCGKGTCLSGGACPIISNSTSS